jgi:hypothetical protein
MPAPAFRPPAAGEPPPGALEALRAPAPRAASPPLRPAPALPPLEQQPPQEEEAWLFGFGSLVHNPAFEHNARVEGARAAAAAAAAGRPAP